MCGVKERAKGRRKKKDVTTKKREKMKEKYKNEWKDDGRNDRETMWDIMKNTMRNIAEKWQKDNRKAKYTLQKVFVVIFFRKSFILIMEIFPKKILLQKGGSIVYCKTCGAKNDENASYCVNCGSCLTVEGNPSSNHFPAQKRKINVAQLVWSIISMVCLCLPLGVVSLIFVIMAQDAKTDEEERNHIKVARTCNLIASILGVAIYVLCFFFFLAPFLFLLIGLA